MQQQNLFKKFFFYNRISKDSVTAQIREYYEQQQIKFTTINTKVSVANVNFSQALEPEQFEQLKQYFDPNNSQFKQASVQEFYAQFGAVDAYFIDDYLFVIQDKNCDKTVFKNKLATFIFNIFTSMKLDCAKNSDSKYVEENMLEYSENLDFHQVTVVRTKEQVISLEDLTDQLEVLGTNLPTFRI